MDLMTTKDLQSQLGRPPLGGNIARVVLPGREQYFVMRWGDSVVIEPLDNVLLKGAPFLVRNPLKKPRSAKLLDDASR